MIRIILESEGDFRGCSDRVTVFKIAVRNPMHESRTVNQSDQECDDQECDDQECDDQVVSGSARESQAASATVPDQPVLFFDGVCGLCNQSVNFAMSRDRKGRLLYSPLQGETAAAVLSAEDLENLDTVILRSSDGQVYRRSAAIVRVLWLLGIPWKICGCLLWLIPLPLRDLGYRLVSKVRYRVFGKHETCRLPTPEERARFLP